MPILHICVLIVSGTDIAMSCERIQKDGSSFRLLVIDPQGQPGKSTVNSILNMDMGCFNGPFSQVGQIIVVISTSK